MDFRNNVSSPHFGAVCRPVTERGKDVVGRVILAAPEELKKLVNARKNDRFCDVIIEDFPSCTHMKNDYVAKIGLVRKKRTESIQDQLINDRFSIREGVDGFREGYFNIDNGNTFLFEPVPVSVRDSAKEMLDKIKGVCKTAEAYEAQKSWAEECNQKIEEGMKNIFDA